MPIKVTQGQAEGSNQWTEKGCNITYQKEQGCVPRYRNLRQNIAKVPWLGIPVLDITNPKDTSITYFLTYRREIDKGRQVLL